MSITQSRFAILLTTCLALSLGLITLTLPLQAQDRPFATNTPARGFATNTPEFVPTPVAPSITISTNTPEPSVTPIGPAAGLNNYALRLWLERDLLNALHSQIEMVDAENIDSHRAVQILQYELEFRFPGAPRSMEDRGRLVSAMIDAPLGTISMQSVIRPYIENAINSDLLEDGQFEGFTIDILNANLDAGNINDAIIHIVYPDAVIDAIRYEDYVFALGDADGGYKFVPSTFVPPIVPYNGVRTIELNRLTDVNDDGVDELALLVDDGDLNKRLYVLAYRNGNSVELTRPSENLRLGELVDWDTDPDEDRRASPIRTKLYQTASEKWSCISELVVTWNYESNFYRPSIADNETFRNQDSFGCTMYEAEPIFAMRPASATQFITDQLINYGSTVRRTDRAVMTLAMLYALDDQVGLAQDTAIAAQATNNDIESWVGLQSELFMEMINEPDNTKFEICVALAEADHGEEGACDVKSLLGRIFENAIFPADTPIDTQLENIGLDVVQTVVISEVGRADRIAVDFGIKSAGWWAFVADQGTYTATPIDTPAGYEDPDIRPQLVTVPASAYATLLVDNDPAGVINIIETSRVANPDTPFSEAFRFLEGFANDLLSNREVARQTYYAVWADYPESIWGRLAGRHLELR